MSLSLKNKFLTKKIAAMALIVVTLIASGGHLKQIIDQAYAQSNSASNDLTDARINAATGMQYIGQFSSAAKRTVSWSRSVGFAGAAVNVYYTRESTAGSCSAPDPASQGDWTAANGVGIVTDSYIFPAPTIAGLPDANDYCLLVRNAALATPWAVTDLFTVDNTVPLITARQTQDLDGDGKIDAVKITFNDTILDSTVTAGNFDVAGYAGEAFSSTTNGDVADNNVIYITFTEGGAPDSDAIPNLTYTAGTLTDLSDNALATNGPTATTDKAPPVVISIANYDATTDNGATAGQDGQNDEIYVTMSEPITDASVAGGDFLIDADENGSYETSASLKAAPQHGQTDAANDKYITLNAAAQMPGTFKVGVRLTAGSITENDGAGNANILQSVAYNSIASNTDAAAPFALLRQTQDVGAAGGTANDGTLDAVKVTFSEPISDASIVTGDFTATTNGGGALTESVTQPAGNTIDDNVFYFGFTDGTASDTSNLTKLQITGVVSDLNAVSYVADGAPVAATDLAAPVPTSAVFQDNNKDGTVDRVAVTFSETLGGGYTFDAGNWSFPENTALTLVPTTTVGAVGAVATFNVTAIAGKTSASPLPTIVYTDLGPGQIDDTVNIQNGPTTAINVTDNAAPQIISANVQQVDGTNATAAVTWSEPLSNGAAVVAGNLTYTDPLVSGAASISSVSFSNASASGTITVNVPFIQADVNSDTVKGGAVAQDSGGNVTGGGVAVKLIDNTPPSVVAMYTRDSDNNGKIDAIEIRFNEDMDTASNEAGYTVTGHTISSITWFNWGTGLSNMATLHINETGFDTDAVPTVTYANPPGFAKDKDGDTTGAIDSGKLADFGPTAPTDGAGPAIIASHTLSTSTFQLNFSEPVSFASIATGDLKYNNIAAGAFTSINPATDLAPGSNAATYTVTTGFAFGPGETTAQVKFNAGSVVDDLVAVSNTQTAAVTLTDGIVPTITARQTVDQDRDGKIDAMKITFTENILDSSVTPANFDVAGYVGEAFSATNDCVSPNGASRVADSNYICITFTEGGVADTSAIPNLTYTAGTLTDTNALALVSNGPTASTDTAGPAIFSARSLTTTTVEVTFSENISDASVVAGDVTFNFADPLADGVASAFSSGAANDNIGTFTVPAGGFIGASETTGTVALTGAGVVSDGATVSTQVSTVTVADGIPPLITARDTKDLDANGSIDAIKITFSENINDATVATGDFALSAPYNDNVKSFTASNDCAGGATRVADSNYICLVFAEEGLAAGDTGAVPTVTYTAGTLTDATGGVLATTGAVASTDKALPVFLSSTTADTNGDGTVDQTTLVYSESVAITDGSGADGLPGVAFQNSCTALNFDYVNAGTSSTVITLTGCPGNDTSIIVNPTYTAAAGQIQDLAGAPNEMANAETVTGVDGAKPAFLSATSADTNSDGTVDRVTLTYSEQVDITDAAGGAFDGVTFNNGCTAAAADYSASNTTSSVVTLTGCTAGDTSILVTPTYNAAAGTILDNAAIEMNNAETVTGTDGAPAAFLSATTADVDNNGTVDRLVVTFSEPVDFTDAAGAGNGFTGITLAGGSCTIPNQDLSANQNTTSVNIALTGCTAADTSITVAPTYVSALGDDIYDNALVPLEMNNGETVAGSDGAAPVPLSGIYKDMTGNGTIDRVDVTFSNDTQTLTGPFEAGDHVFNAGSSFGAITPTAAVFVGNDLRISITPASNPALVTGSPVALTYTYTNQGTLGSVNDGITNSVTSAAITQTDGAAPIGTLTLDTDPIYTGDETQGVTITYSERMDDSGPGPDPSVTFTGNVGAMAAGVGAWNAPGTGTSTIWTQTFTHNVTAETTTGVTADSSLARDLALIVEGTSVRSTNDPFDIDTVLPTLTPVTIASDNINDTTQATTGDTVTLSFTGSEQLVTSPVVAISSGGVLVANPILVTNPSGNNWEAAYVVAAGDTDGAVTFTVDFNDTCNGGCVLGNAGTQVTAITAGVGVTVDHTGPGIIITDPADGATVSSPFQLTIDTTASATACEYDTATMSGVYGTGTAMTDGGTSFGATVAAVDGTPTYFIQCRDAAGNLSTEQSRTFTVSTDVVAPVITSVSPTTLQTSTPFSLVANVTEANALSAYMTVDGTPVVAVVGGAAPAQTITYAGYAPTSGTHQIYVRATDAAGNQAETTFEVSYNPNGGDTTAPVFTTVSPTTVQTSTPFSVVANVTEANALSSYMTVDGTPVATVVGGAAPAQTITYAGYAPTVGTHQIYVRATDAAGNQAETTFSVTYDPNASDVTAPVFTSVSPTAVQTSTPFSVVANVTEANVLTAYMTVDGVPVVPVVGGAAPAQTITYAGYAPTQGTHQIYVRATDAAGNWNASTFEVSYNPNAGDTTAPVFTTVSPTTVQTSTPFSVVANVSEANVLTAYMTVDGTPVATVVGGAAPAQTITYAGYAPTVGTHDVYVRATDAAGNQAETTFSVTYDPNASDTTAPVFAAVSPVAVQAAVPFDVVANVTEANVLTAYMTVDGVPVATAVGGAAPAQTITFATYSPAAGTHQIYVRATDAAGNWNASTFEVTFTPPADVAPPVITYDIVPVQTITQTSANIIFTSNENGTAFVNYGTTAAYGNVTINQAITNVGNQTISLAGLTCGTDYFYSVHAWDASNNAADTAGFTFFTTSACGDTTAPVIATISTDKPSYQVTAPADTTVTVTVVDDATATAVSINGNVAAPTPGGWVASFAHPGTIGTYSIVVDATDGSGNTSTGDISYAVVADAPTDTTAPVIASISTDKPSYQATLPADANVVVTVVEDGTAVPVTGVTVNGVTATDNGGGNWTYSIAHSGTVGTYSVIVQATDAAGNIATSSSSYNVVADPAADTTAPAITSVSTNLGSYHQTQDPNVTVTIVEDNTATNVTGVTVNGIAATETGDTGTWTYTFAHAAGTLGTFALTINATDASGNVGTASISYAVVADAPVDIDNLSTSGVTNTAAVINYTVSSFTGGDTGQYRYGTAAYNGVWTALSPALAATSGTQALAGLTANTLYFYQVRFTHNGGTISSSPLSFTTAASASGISVDSLQMTKTFATADNRYKDDILCVGNPDCGGWEWKLKATVNNTAETGFAMKFAQWASGANVLDAAGNMQYAVDANNDGAISGAGAEAWQSVAANTTYPANVTLTGDDDLARGGRQVTVYIQTKVPLLTPGGSYSTSYGIRTQ